MRNFKFFVGFIKPTMTISWDEGNMNEMLGYNDIDAERQLTDLLSEEISRTIDEDIIRRLTREINEGLRS